MPKAGSSAFALTLFWKLYTSTKMLSPYLPPLILSSQGAQTETGASSNAEAKPFKSSKGETKFWEMWKYNLQKKERKTERKKERKTERKKTNSVASNLLAMASNLEEREEKGKKEVQKESKV